MAADEHLSQKRPPSLLRSFGGTDFFGGIVTKKSALLLTQPGAATAHQPCYRTAMPSS